MYFPKPKDKLQEVLDERLTAKLGNIPGLRPTDDWMERFLHPLLALLTPGIPAVALYVFLFRPWL